MDAARTIYTTVFLYSENIRPSEVKSGIAKAMGEPKVNKWHRAIHPDNLVGLGRLTVDHAGLYEGYTRDYTAYAMMDTGNPVPDGLQPHILEAIDSTVSMDCEGPYKQVDLGEFIVDILWWHLGDG